ncbi:MAG: tetratricopeptide repeat protein [Candidatus Aminicenantes bacterium]|nr:tetratricopeptide repeat protein [Candidatus Aminicenantes bacterium]
MKTKCSRILAPVFMIGGFGFWVSPSDSFPSAHFFQASSPLSKLITDAKAKLREGVNRRDTEACKSARDQFLGAMLETKTNQAGPAYYVALADYRLATFAFISGDTAEAGRMIAEGQQYLERVLASSPDSGESLALYGYLLGLEIALHPDRAMALGAKSARSFGQAEAKEPANPRVHLLKGIYWLYVPEAFGGGPDTALPSLEKAEALFAKENVTDPMKPDWGKDEAFLYLGLVYRAKNDPAKARAMFEKTLAVNPDFGWARSELASLDKK